VLRRFIAGTVLRPVTTTMVTIAILVFGLVAATRLPVELLPDLSYPTITVETTDQDAAPGEVEELVTRPIEERVGAVPGVLRIESVSREGQSEIVLDFEWGTRIDQAMADVREKLDRVTLPLTATRPIVLRYDPSQEPIMRLALRGPDRGDGSSSREEMAHLRELAERVVKRELEKLPGVAAVQLHGGELDEVLVEIDPERLAALGVTTQDVVVAIQRDNVNRPGGAVSERDNRYLVRTLHESRTPEELGLLIVRSEGGAELRLRDIARVRRAPVDREELSLVADRHASQVEAVELAVYREGDANIVAAAQRVEANLGRLPLPPGHEVIVLSNQAGFIRSAVDEVRSNTLVGGALAVLVLLFFLRNLRSTLVIAVAIPISLLATFVPLSMLDVSLNVMSLGGLALGVGMLVDNSIVVLESIARVRESGDGRSSREHAVDGTAEIAPSVVASTLTTVAVFFPMSFVEGVAGQLVRDLSYAVSFSLVSSMLVSLTLVPVLQSFGERPAEVADEPTGRSLLSKLVIIPALLAWPIALLVRGLTLVFGLASRPLTFAYDALERRYPAVLRVALRRRGVVLLGALGLCIIALRLADEGGRTLLPEVHQGEFFVQVSLPQGASLPRTTRTLQALSTAIADDPEVDRRFTRIGSVTQAGSAGGGVTGTHLGQLNIRLHPDVVDREATEARLLLEMQAANPESEAMLRLGRPALFTFGPPIEIQVFAEDPQLGADHARRLLPGLKAIDDLVEVVPDDLSGRPEVRVHFDRERLGRLGIGVDEAALAVQRAIQGEVATTLYSADRQLDVRVQLPAGRRSQVEHVRRIPIAVVSGVAVELGSVAQVEPAIGPAEIRRIDGRRGLRIRARVDGVDLGGVAQKVRAVLDEHEDDDPKVEAMVAGQADEMELSMRSLMFTAALSIFLVYVVMASSFESLLHPFLIMFTVPLALAGVGLVCWVSQTPLSAMVGIGVVVLSGIVVNNAIVLVNAVNDRRGRGLDVREALVQAGLVRVRPIIMTTLTTVLGLTPMALGFGEGAALRRPLALAVIGGLGIATVLTLVVIPCAYSLLPGRTRDAWKQP
jgi:hydrophobic/amphiphilic exporter-1 (mainly G- bacteria), HAE1 family